MANIRFMIHELIMVGVIALLTACDNVTNSDSFIEENYSFWNATIQDSIYCLQIGNQYVNEKFVIDLPSIKHELVDQTQAKVKIKGTFSKIMKRSFCLKTNSETINGEFLFDTPNSLSIVNHESILQGVIQLQPQTSFKVDGILILNVQKKSL